MTHISNVKISDFKGISNLDIDVGLINIITGENNAGKTSLLQAIDLAFNPRKITNYGDSINYLIKSQESSATITVEYKKTTQTSLDQFGKDSNSNENVHERQLQISEPDRQESIQLYIDTVLNVAKTGPDADLLVNRFSQRTLDLDIEDEDPQEMIQNAVRNAIASLSEDEIYSWADGSTIILSVNGEQYPYVYLDESYNEFKKEIIQKASNELLEKIGREEEPLIEDDSNDFEQTLRRALNDLLVPRFGRGRFINNRPPEVDGVRFVSDSIQLTQDDVDLDKENAAVRLSQVGEYLRENQLVADLDTLSLDQVVFEDPNGEKYQVPYDFMGDGLRAMIGVLWELSSTNRRDNVLLLEEAENHMHPEFINELAFHLTEIVENKRIQTFITTHNIDFIRAFFDVEDKDTESFLIDEFKLLKMDQRLPEEYDYVSAKNHATQLQLDLRG